MNLILRRAELDLRRQVGRLFEDFLGDGWWGGDRTAEWGPAVDIAETPETVVIKAEVPGVNPKEIEVSVNENTLTLDIPLRANVAPADIAARVLNIEFEVEAAGAIENVTVTGYIVIDL